ncbi:HD-GYP domain-containing protein [Noviherbaspirillum pedocola]|uniref:HD-GYP domain-containing protein n=1 Tax=Noviherbaspirillum pedocola TaxID=2801341 RepID=A0A934SXE4_9BURK|nr:HD-GYP domain-containing protein [Noviherbaspirillum pedocola]MBK4738601.1 HD-GYP domain-containing protein [Noviherbaspirillum pedocola]
MDAMKKSTAVRIALVSALLAAVASPGAWLVAHRKAEQGTVLLAIEESRRLLRHSDALDLKGPDAVAHARRGVDMLAGGLFDIAELYDATGQKLATAMTPEGREVEKRIPEHPRLHKDEASFESLTLSDKRWLLRVFVPLHAVGAGGSAEVAGYFEGVRIIPVWQRTQILQNALAAASMVALASLLCGAAIYPVVMHLSAENEHKAKEILDAHISLIKALGRAIAKRDFETGAHNYRVAWVAARIGERLGLSAKQMQSLIVGSFLHDIGKIGIPDAILRKPGSLDTGEAGIMHAHVAHGEDVISDIAWLREAKSVVSAHHEKWDGSGYPHGLSGNAIPPAARIFSVADVFDALISERPYKKGVDFKTTMSMMEKETGGHFDPAVMAAFRPIAEDIFTVLTSCSEEKAWQLMEERLRFYFGL